MREILHPSQHTSCISIPMQPSLGASLYLRSLVCKSAIKQTQCLTNRKLLVKKQNGYGKASIFTRLHKSQLP